MSLGCLILVPSLLKPTDEDAFFKPSWRASFSRCSYALLCPTSSSQSNKGVELVKFTEEFECKYKSTPTNVLRSSKCIGVHDMPHYYGMHHKAPTWLVTMSYQGMHHMLLTMTWYAIWHIWHGSLLWHDMPYHMWHHKAPTWLVTMPYHMLCHMTWLVTMTYDMMGVGSSTWSLVFANKSEASGARADLVEQEAS